MARIGSNIYRRKDGRYEARYRKGRDQSGRIIYGYVYGYRFSEVREKQQFHQYMVAQGREMPHEHYVGTLREWAGSWMIMNQAKVKPSTHSLYHSILKKHILPALGERKLVGITPPDIRAFITCLQDKGLNSNTIRGIARLLGRILKSAVEGGALPVNPCDGVSLPKREKIDIDPLSRADQQKLEDAAKGQKGGTAVLLALYTGMRIGEICALRWSDVDLQGGVLHIHQTLQRIVDVNERAAGRKTRLILGKPKSNDSVRSIPLTPSLKRLLAKERAHSSGEYVLRGRNGLCEPRTLRYQFHRIARRAGIEPVRFHALRHTFATRCIEQNMDIVTVSELLGHASVKMTLDVYAGSTWEQKERSIRRLDVVRRKAG